MARDWRRLTGTLWWFTVLSLMDYWPLLSQALDTALSDAETSDMDEIKVDPDKDDLLTAATPGSSRDELMLPGQLHSLSIPLLLSAFGETWEDVEHLSRAGATARILARCPRTMSTCIDWLYNNLRNGWAEALTSFVIEHRCSLGNTLFMECQEELKRWVSTPPKQRALVDPGGDGAKLSGLTARELAVAQATKGFTDWSCPPGVKQRTFVPPIEGGESVTLGQQLAQQRVQPDRAEIEGQGARGASTDHSDDVKTSRSSVVGHAHHLSSPVAVKSTKRDRTTNRGDHEHLSVALTERATKQWKDFALAFLVLLIMRHLLRRHVRRREVAEAVSRLPDAQVEQQRVERQRGRQHGEVDSKPPEERARYRAGVTRSSAGNRAVDNGAEELQRANSTSSIGAADGSRSGLLARLSYWLVSLAPAGTGYADATTETVSVSAAEIAALRAKAARLDATSVHAREADRRACSICLEDYAILPASVTQAGEVNSAQTPSCSPRQAPKTPRVLPCGHTFCEGCLAQILVQTLPAHQEGGRAGGARGKAKHKKMTCPKCRVQSAVPGGRASQLPVNFDLID